MSRIGKQPIVIPQNVEIKIDGDLIMVKGPKGELSWRFHPSIRAQLSEGKILISPAGDADLSDKKVAAFWGLTRALVFNMVKGVIEGFEKRLEIEGVGYRASVQGEKLILNLGYSHPIEIEPPEGIALKVEKNVIIISGIDKALVGQIAAKIRSKRKPEPYKGKGIRYQGEKIKIKAGKKAVSAGM